MKQFKYIDQVHIAKLKFSKFEIVFDSDLGQNIDKTATFDHKGNILTSTG